ncbi:hypothetical protein HMPREF0541_02890 [Lacticaseibacillus rhamnosus ATCC 21052]|nr:hypothetical protein HMPREF0541_02890 [Lacticaseibacillus rhamnosus ATCC 21052]
MCGVAGMHKRLRLIAAYGLLMLFFHLKKTSGFDFTPTIVDGYLLISWLVLAPRYLDQIDHSAQRFASTGRSTKDYVADMKKNMNLYQDFIYATTPVMATILESGGIDTIGVVIIKFVFQVLLILTAPILWTLALGFRQLQQAWHRIHLRQ